MRQSYAYADGLGYITAKEHLYKWKTHFYAQSGTISGRTFYKSGNGHYGIWYTNENSGQWCIGNYDSRYVLMEDSTYLFCSRTSIQRSLKKLCLGCVTCLWLCGKSRKLRTVFLVSVL